MKETRAAAAQGTKVPPTYFNITESTLELLNPLPPPPHRPNSHPHNHVFSLNTAGSNRLLFSAPSDHDLVRWTTGLRLAAWERSRLEEIYTGHLIRAGRREPRSPLVNGRLEGWTRVRVMGGIDWHRLWLVLSDPEAPSTTDAQSQRRRHSLFGIGGGQNDTIAEPNTGVAMASFYNEPRTAKNRTSSLPVLTMTMVTQAYAVFPERLEVMSQSNLTKIVGRISGELVTIEGGLRDSGWALIMPEAPVEDAAPPTTPSPLNNMMRWVTAFHDVFKLYGRPQQYSWDNADPKSLWFAYPQGEFRGDLFLNIDEASMANHRLNTPGIRALFLNLVARRMGDEEKKTVEEQRGDKKLEDEKAKGAFTLPPLSFNDENAKAPTPPPVPESARQVGAGAPGAPGAPGAAIGAGAGAGAAAAAIGAGAVGAAMLHHHEGQPQPQQQPQQQPDPRSLTPITEAEASRHNSTHRPEDAHVGPHAVGQAITANQAVLPQHNPQQPSYLPVSDDGSVPPVANRSNSSQTFGRGDDTVRGETVESLTTPASQTQPTVWSQESGGITSANGSIASTIGPQGVSRTESPPGFRGGTSPVPPVSTEAASVSPPGQVGTAQRVTSPSKPPPSSFKHAQYGPSEGALSEPQQQLPQPPVSDGSHGKAGIAAGAAAVGAAAFGAAALSSRPSDGSRSGSGSHHSDNMHHPRPTKRLSVQSEQPVAGLRDEPAALYLMNMVEEPAGINQPGQQKASDKAARPTIVTSTDNVRPEMHRRPSGARAYPSPAVRSASNGSRQSEVVSAGSAGAGAAAAGAAAAGAAAAGAGAAASAGDKPKVVPEARTQPEPVAAAAAAPVSLPQTQPEVPATLPKSTTNHDIASDAAAYLAYADNEPAQAQSQPQPQPQVQEAARSSFAPSKAATERRAKAEAQASEQQRSMAVPGGGKRQQRSTMASAPEDWSDDEDEAEEEDEEVTSPTVGSHGPDFSQSRRGSRALPLPPGQAAQYPQQYQREQQPREQQYQPQTHHHREHRPLPVRNDVSNGNAYNDGYDGNASPRARSPPAPHRHLPAQPGQAQQQRRTEAPIAPPAARQNVWNANFAVDHGMNEPPKGGKFVELEEPSVALTKAFSPGGLLQAGMQDKQDRSAKRQEEVARETGSSLVNVPEKPPPPQTGLMGAVAAHERDRKNPGGIGATLTDRDRDRRIAEERQRKIEELQRQQMEQFGGNMNMGGSMYGGFPPQYPQYGMPMGYPQGGYGMMNPQAQQQAMMAAQMAYQQTMMAMSHAGSQAGDAPDGRTSPTASRTSPPPFPPYGGYGQMGWPTQSMYGFPQYGMNMPMMGMGGMGPQGQGHGPQGPGWASPVRGSMHEGSYAGSERHDDRQAS